MKRLIWSAVAALCLAVPVVACAADGYVTGNVNLRAGPDAEYPLITTLAVGTPVSVQGCTTDWAWCDVIAYGSRGWIAGNFIQYDYQGQPVLLPAYGARIGVPIITFVISSYWDTYYRNRPFYRQRTTWYRRPAPHHPPPRPIHRSPRPIHALPARPAPRSQQRPTTRHTQARPVTARPQSRPPQSSRPQTSGRPGTRPEPHAKQPSKAKKGKPAPKKKTDGHKQHA